MNKKSKELIEKEISRLRYDYGTAFVDERWTVEMHKTVGDLLSNMRLHETPGLNYLQEKCAEWAKQRNPKIALAEIEGKDYRQRTETLIAACTPKGFIKIIADLEKKKAADNMKEVLRTIILTNKVDVTYLIKQLEIAVAKKNLPKFIKIANPELRTELRQFIKEHGAPALVLLARELREQAVARRLNKLKDQLHEHHAMFYPDGIAAMQKTFLEQGSRKDKRIAR